MAADDGGRNPGSSWRRWIGGVDPRTSTSEPARPAADAPAAPRPPEPRPASDDLHDVRLDWPAADAGDEAVEEDDLDTGEYLGDAEDAEAGFATHLLPAVPLLPAIAGRVDALDGQLRALGMRIDVLSNSVAAVRTAIGDRIDGYAETAAASARHAEGALEEHRRSTERAVGEVRRGLAASDEVLRRLAARIDEVATDVSTLLGGGAGAVAPPAFDVDAVLAGIDERLASSSTPSAASESMNAALLDAVAAIEDRLAEPDERGAVLAALAGIDERLAAIEVLVADLPDPAAEPPAAASPLAAPAPAVDTGPIEQAIAEVRSLVEVVVDTMPASAEGSADDLAERVASLVLARIDVDALAKEVADRLEQRFEVVVENSE